VISSSPTATRAHVGDWLEVSGAPGSPPRRGQILEVLGHADHPHCRVRWDEEHESLFYPSEATVIVRQVAGVDHRRP